MEQYSKLMASKVEIVLPSETKSEVVTLKTELPVTVIVPSYNEENTISQTLDSLKNQTGHVEQIIVVDDYSTDKTGQIAAQYDGVTVLRPSKILDLRQYHRFKKVL